MDLHEEFTNAVARWSGFIGGAGTWFTISESELGFTPGQQVMLMGVKAVFSILVAIACGFAGKMGGDMYLHFKEKRNNKNK
jgi:hypothetical protein